MEVLQPQEVQTVRPSAMLPGMLERITGSFIASELQTHIKVATSAQITHAPVLKWQFRNVLIYPSGYATWTGHDRYGDHRKLGEFAQPMLHVPQVRYCMNSVIWRYFGHWMSDGIPSALIEPDHGALWMPPNPIWEHAKDYLDIFDLAPLEAPLVYADEVTFYADFAQGSQKRSRYAELRARLHAKIQPKADMDYVYLYRGASGNRRVIDNEAALIDRLVAQNWTILDVTKATVRELQSTIFGAKMVMGIEGSHLNHAQYGLCQGSHLVILIPHDRFVTVHVARATAKEIKTGLVVLQGSETKGYHADIDEVLRTIDLTLSL